MVQSWPYMFHVDVGFPQGVHTPDGQFEFLLSHEARAKLRRPEYEGLDFPDTIMIGVDDVKVIYCDENGAVMKAIATVAHGNEFLVCVFDPANNFLITWWTSGTETPDLHMAESEYNDPSELEI